MSDQQDIAKALVESLEVDGDAYWIARNDAIEMIAAALADAKARGIEQARDVIRAARADYPDDVFPTLPAAVGIRFICDRILAELSALATPPAA